MRLASVLLLFLVGCGGDSTPESQPDAMPMIDAALPPPDAAPCVVPPFTAGVSTLAGCADPGAVDGVRAVARFANPTTVLVAPGGTVYVADFDNDRIRAVDAAGAVTTLVEQAGFAKPFGMVLGAAGTLYVQTDDNDSGEHSGTTGTIWSVDLGSGAATVVVRNVGRPRGLARLADGRLVMSDYVHAVVRLLDPGTGQVTELAGTFDAPGFADDTGAAARFDEPYGVAILGDGRIAVADRANHRIRAVTLDGIVTTFAGTGTPGHDDGPAGTASFRGPKDVAVDGAGTVYVADADNFVVRRIAAGEVTTIVGEGADGWLDADDLRAARLHGLEGLDVAADGAMLWIGDGSRGDPVPYHRVRVVDLVP